MFSLVYLQDCAVNELDLLSCVVIYEVVEIGTSYRQEIKNIAPGSVLTYTAIS